MRGRRCPVLVGRETETALLRGIVAQAGRRSGTALLVGEAGVGKSRLLAHVCAQAEDEGLLVLRGRAVPTTVPVPHRPLVEALQSGVRRGALHPDRVAPRGLAAALAALLPALDPPAGCVAAEGLVGRAEAVLALLATARSPVLVALEDLHWADPGTLAVLEYLCDALDGSGVSLLATTRGPQEPAGAPDLAAALRDHDGALVLDLPRLTPEEVGRVAAACLGAAPGPQLARRLAEQADGLPLLVEELVAEAGPGVPRRFADGVLGRLQQLDAAARRAVQVAAVLGRDVDWPLLGDVLGVGPEEVGRRLRAAARAGLLEHDDAGLRFRHALTREAVLAALLPPERCAVAEAALQVLTTDRAAPGRGRPELVERLRRLLADGGADPEAEPRAAAPPALPVAPAQRRALAEVPGLAALGVTPREADVLLLVSEGATNREVAQRLFLSPRTVEKHVEHLLAKTGAPNRATLAVRALALAPSGAAT